MFVSTNFDDALVLIVYFAHAAEGKDGLKAHHIWSGQLLGFSIIMAITLVGTSIGSLVPPRFSGLLGFVPLWMGLERMWKAWNVGDYQDDGGSNNFLKSELAVETRKVRPLPSELTNVNEPICTQQSRPADTAGSTLRPRKRDPTAIGNVKATSIKDCSKNQIDGNKPCNVVEDEEERPAWIGFIIKAMQSEWVSFAFTARSLMLAAVTVSNGGDNASVYVPGLVTYSGREIVISLVVFYLLLVAWIFAAGKFVSFHLVAKLIEKYGDCIIPVALVLLGIYILFSTDALTSAAQLFDNGA
ncbi:unnamed protein product [Phytophthora fragariaefolia]|uniref:Unnamed protein product n=1 Tax=Phytophthora fragariaefolia TaxID=1490495 RepID=A0A9W6XW47_9STRA|nr:unnamed protein product [Phytophthora fragariaefolia]